MDNYSSVKLFLDNLLNQGQIQMFSVHNERSGSTLIKIRVSDKVNGGHICSQSDTGEVTQDVFLHKKSEKRRARDITRSKDYHTTNDPSAQSGVSRNPDHVSSRTRSSYELPRSENISPAATPFMSEVPSPVIPSPPAMASMLECNSPEAIDQQHQSPEKQITFESEDTVNEDSLHDIECDENTDDNDGARGGDSMCENDIESGDTNDHDSKVKERQERVARIKQHMTLMTLIYGEPDVYTDVNTGLKVYDYDRKGPQAHWKKYPPD